jgi:CelD/BcsL family acetyltransferase involved in cellulose biosynthesis
MPRATSLRELFGAFESVPVVIEPLALSLSIVREQASFVMLKEAWEDLFERAAVKTPFLRYSWARLCWDRQRADRGVQLFLIVVRNGGRVALIAPFVAHREFFFFCDLLFLDSRTPQYNEVLVEKSPHTSAYLAYLCGALRKMHRIRRLRLNWMRDDALLASHLASLRQTARGTECAPYLDLTRFEGWEAFFGSLSKKLRSDHRRQLRHLEKHGSVAFRLVNEDTLHDDIAWLFAEKRAWLERTGRSAAWFIAPGTEELYGAAAAEGLVSGRTWLFKLCVQDKIIAALLGFWEERTLYLSKIAHDPAWQLYSPGRTVLLLSIEHAFRKGLEKCDLMIGATALKLSIAKEAVSVSNRKVALHYP